MRFIVSKQKGGQYFVHPTGNAKFPIPGSFGDKHKAIKFAAKLEGVTPKEYIRMRKEVENREYKER